VEILAEVGFVEGPGRGADIDVKLVAGFSGDLDFPLELDCFVGLSSRDLVGLTVPGCSVTSSSSVVLARAVVLGFLLGAGSSTTRILGLEERGADLVEAKTGFSPDELPGLLALSSGLDVGATGGSFAPEPEGLGNGGRARRGARSISDFVWIAASTESDSRAAAASKNATSSSESTGLGRSSLGMMGDGGRAGGAFAVAPKLSLEIVLPLGRELDIRRRRKGGVPVIASCRERG
jgi:hypothetical protein